MSQYGIEVATRALSGKHKGEFPREKFPLSFFFGFRVSPGRVFLLRDQKFAIHITVAAPELPYMYSAQIADYLLSDEEFPSVGNCAGISGGDCDYNARLRGGRPVADEGIGMSATSSAELDIPPVEKLARTSPLIAELVFCGLTVGGVRYATALKQSMGSGSPPSQEF